MIKANIIYAYSNLIKHLYFRIYLKLFIYTVFDLRSQSVMALQKGGLGARKVRGTTIYRFKKVAEAIFSA